MTRTPPRADRPALAVEAVALTKRYRRQRSLRDMLRPRAGVEAEAHALTDVTIRIEEGEVFGLLGPNGSGKTTFLKLLSTILSPTSGTARIFGHDVTRDARTVRSLLALVSGEERSLYWRLTGRQNLEFFGRLYGLDRQTIRRRGDDLLTVFDLRHAAGVRVAEYSTGMKQKLAIARGLLSGPRLLFLDEPTRGLDPVAAHSLLTLVRDRAVEHYANTVILTTHIAREVEQLCRRIAILHRGSVAYQGTVEELQASMEERQMYFVTVRGMRAHVFDSLCSRLGAESCRQVGSEHDLAHIQLSLDGTVVTLSDVLRHVLGSGADVVECTRRERSFEETFRAVFDRRLKRPVPETATAASEVGV